MEINKIPIDEKGLRYIPKDIRHLRLENQMDVWEAFTHTPKNRLWHEYLKEAAEDTLGYDIFPMWNKYGFTTRDLGLPYILLDVMDNNNFFITPNILAILLMPLFGKLGNPGLVSSKTEGRRMLKEGAVYVNDIKVTDEKYRFCNLPEEDGGERNDFIFPGGILKLSCGKKYKIRNSVICTWW